MHWLIGYIDQMIIIFLTCYGSRSIVGAKAHH